MTILQEAEALVAGPRNADYGHPANDYARTAKIWTGILLDKLKPGAEVTPADAILCMIGVKMSREAHRPKRDNRVDGAGYWQCLDQVNAAEPGPDPGLPSPQNRRQSSGFTNS